MAEITSTANKASAAMKVAAVNATAATTICGGRDEGVDGSDLRWRR